MYISEIFHLIFLGHASTGVTEIEENKTADNGDYCTTLFICWYLHLAILKVFLLFLHKKMWICSLLSSDRYLNLITIFLRVFYLFQYSIIVKTFKGHFK